MNEKALLYLNEIELLLFELQDDLTLRFNNIRNSLTYVAGVLVLMGVIILINQRRIRKELRQIREMIEAKQKTKDEEEP